jgi:hypothetical protein
MAEGNHCFSSPTLQHTFAAITSARLVAIRSFANSTIACDIGCVRSLWSIPYAGTARRYPDRTASLREGPGQHAAGVSSPGVLHIPQRSFDPHPRAYRALGSSPRVSGHDPSPAFRVALLVRLAAGPVYRSGSQLGAQLAARPRAAGPIRRRHASVADSFLTFSLALWRASLSRHRHQIEVHEVGDAVLGGLVDLLAGDQRAYRVEDEDRRDLVGGQEVRALHPLAPARGGGDLAGSQRLTALPPCSSRRSASRADFAFAGFATKTGPAGAMVRAPLLFRRSGAYGDSSSRQVQWNTTVLDPSVLVRMLGTACCRPLPVQ